MYISYVPPSNSLFTVHKNYSTLRTRRFTNQLKEDMKVT